MKLSDEYGIGDCMLTAQQHDPLIALGVIEYANDRFAHLHANERFLSEFALSNHPRPASGVFREHLDDKNYNILMQTFAYCSETKQEAMVRLSRTDDTGAQRQYQGHVYYNGEIGKYADLSVILGNVTHMKRFGFDEESAQPGNREGQVRTPEMETDELKRKLDFLSSAIDNMPNPIFMKASDGRFVFFNRRYAECFGMTREEHLGQTVLDLEYLPEEDRRRYQAEDLSLIESGKISSYDKNFVFNDGKTHPSFYWSKGFVCAETGEYGLIGEIVDISGERKTKDDLVQIVRGTSYMFDRFFVVDLENSVFSEIKKNGSNGKIAVSAPFDSFTEKALGRFYNPADHHMLDLCFSTDGLHQLLKEKDDYYFECKDKHTANQVFGATIYCIERKDGLPAKVIYAIRDITDAKSVENEYRKKLKKANQKLQDLANRDGLTGLYNRRGLMEAVHTQLDEDSRVAMLLIDVDHFKQVNDTHGHQSGDKLLVRVAELLRASFRADDILVRLGGDEFMALLLNCDRDCGSFIPKKIQEINRRLQKPEDDTPAGSLSVGVAFSRAGERQELYDRADEALYRVKEQGRCGCCIYEEICGN